MKESDIQYLNTNKEIVGIGCGTLDPKKENLDFLLIGSSTNLLVHDCAHNSDIFDKELNEGLSSMVVC